MMASGVLREWAAAAKNWLPEVLQALGLRDVMPHAHDDLRWRVHAAPDRRCRGVNDDFVSAGRVQDGLVTDWTSSSNARWETN